jgi:(p)ppGpp synthase/HD superfamily hydrolase
MAGDEPVFSPAFTDALLFVVDAHGADRRKTAPGEPPGPSYLGHLLGTAALVIEDGGSEAEVIGALLHDSIEDAGVTEAELEDRFGPDVAAIVVGCTDSVERPRPPWRERKEGYLAHLESASASVLRVSNADKLYNARAILADLRRVGDRLWDRFKPDKADNLWYYRELGAAFSRLNPGDLADELKRTVDEMHRVVGAPDA